VQDHLEPLDLPNRFVGGSNSGSPEVAPNAKLLDVTVISGTLLIRTSIYLVPMTAGMQAARLLDSKNLI
jgi:hypothetical protein